MFVASFSQDDKFSKMKITGEFSISGSVYSEESSILFREILVESHKYSYLKVKSTPIKKKEWSPERAHPKWPCPLTTDDQQFTCFTGYGMLQGEFWAHDIGNDVTLYYYYNIKKDALGYVVFEIPYRDYYIAYINGRISTHTHLYGNTHIPKKKNDGNFPSIFK